MGGAEISLQLLSEELVRRGHQVRVITLCDKPLRSFSIINGVEVVYIPLRNIYWPFSGRRRNVLLRFLWHVIDNYNLLMKTPFRKEVAYFQPDIVNTNNLAVFSVAVWGVVAAMGITLAHTSRYNYLMQPTTTMYY
ncbi:glycosyltransferase, partial [Serratia sp. IR-2025]